MYHEDVEYPIEGIESCQLSFAVYDNIPTRGPPQFWKRWIHLETITALNLNAPIAIQRWRYDPNEAIKQDEKITLIPN